MNTAPPFSFIVTRFVLVVVAIAPGGCVLGGDCWPDVTADVRLDSQSSPAQSNLIVGAAVRIYETDVSGVDREGVPIGERFLPFVLEPAAAGSFEFRGFPYPSWYIAFVDTNGNRRLDSDEPFGVDPLNPRPGTCESYVTAIEINRVRGRE